MIEYLTLESVLYIVDDAGWTIRDVGLLDSAVARPRSTVLGADAYPTIELNAAALLHSLVSNPTLVDGNKRLGWQAMRAFVVTNGYDVSLTEDEAFDLVMDVASGRSRDVAEIAVRLRLVPAG